PYYYGGYDSYPYYGYSSAYVYPTPSYTENVIVTPPAVVANAPPAAIAPAASTTATIHVTVPTPDTQVVVNGALTKQTGIERTYATADLQPGQAYRYTFTATCVSGVGTVT